MLYRKNKVPATLHVYPTGGHGWGFQDHFKYKQQWTQELEKWLRDGVVFPENPEPMLRIGKSYLGTKYVANTLDQDGEESLVIRTDAVDCLTFVEYTLAQALGSSFADNLQKIRYRDGIINGYPSRLHYTSEWIENGIRHGFLTDITAKNSAHTQKISLSYMSTHPKQYKKLADSPENVRQMAEYEKSNLRKSRTLVAEKRTAGSRIALDHEWRHYCYYNEDARTGHCSCGNSRI